MFYSFLQKAYREANADDKETVRPSERYEGIDSFRIFGIYGVVLIHFYHDCFCGPNASIEHIIRLRDCTFPFIILTSFFLIARSAWRKPERSFRHFALGRFKRLEIPLLIWTVIYWGIWNVGHPLVYGYAIPRPPATLISGYAHLWFLQFIFLGSIVLYPFVGLRALFKRHRWQMALCCLAIVIAHVLLLRPLVVQLQSTAWMSRADFSFTIFVANINLYLPYVPTAIVIAMWADKITALYKHRTIRLLSLLSVAVTLLIHFAFGGTELTRFFYSLAVFLAVLQPWPASVVNLLRPLAIYSYPVYILHYLVSRMLVAGFHRTQVEFTPGTLLAGSVIVFGLSLLCAVAIRRVFPFDWLLPLTPIPYRPGSRIGVTPRVQFARTRSQNRLPARSL